MRNVASLFSENYLHQTYSYAEYLALMNLVVTEQRTTGPKQTPELAEYTRLNLHRMNRLNKTTVLSQELQQLIYQIEAPQTWYLLTEAWCGDASQSVPVIAKIAAMNPHLTLRLLLRDEHPEIMDEYLTHGGRSIPKLIALDADGNIREMRMEPISPLTDFSFDFQDLRLVPVKNKP